MIRYALACEHEHEFEGWFGSSDDFDDQSARGMIECPICATKAVRKQIMTPAVAGTKKKAASEPAGTASMLMEAMGKIRRHVEENFDYVGDAFAVEARAIHEGRSEDRGIYGEATPKEIADLDADGVRIAPMPPEPLKKTKIN